MSVLTYYRLSLVLPVLLPLAVSPLLLIDKPLPEWVGWVVGIPVGLLLFSLLIGGIPYLVLACVLLLWMRGKTEQQIQRASRLAPLLMLPVFAVCIIGYTIVADPRDWELPSVLFFYVYCAMFILPIGYIYVGVVHGILVLLQRWGMVYSSNAGK